MSASPQWDPLAVITPGAGRGRPWRPTWVRPAEPAFHQQPHGSVHLIAFIRARPCSWMPSRHGPVPSQQLPVHLALRLSGQLTKQRHTSHTRSAHRRPRPATARRRWDVANAHRRPPLTARGPRCPQGDPLGDGGQLTDRAASGAPVAVPLAGPRPWVLRAATSSGYARTSGDHRARGSDRCVAARPALRCGTARRCRRRGPAGVRRRTGHRSGRPAPAAGPGRPGRRSRPSRRRRSTGRPLPRCAEFAPGRQRLGLRRPTGRTRTE